MMPYDLENMIINFSENIADYKDQRSTYNEDATRREYIDPLLNLLGWDVANIKGIKHHLREVITENYVNKTDRPDYTCTVSGVKKFFIEAKKPSIDIKHNNKSALQARRYGFSAKHYITVLTNFEYLLIYDSTVLPKENDESHVALIKEFHYTEYINKWDEICGLISRETVFSGEFEEKFKNLLDHRDVKTVDEYFLEQINGWRVKLSQYLFDKYSETNQSDPLPHINDITQTFINQMIFLRICEDRNLPLYHKLSEVIEDRDQVKEEVLKILKNADEKYNSGLFNNSTEMICMDNYTILEMIEDLYYPRSPYIFNVIESNLLGEIYELFLSERLIQEDGEIKLVKVRQTKKKASSRLKNKDVVSTRIEIVKFIVSNTLTPLVHKKKPQEILLLKIADIACGSGVFLLESYNFLINYVTEWYKENDITFLIERESGNFCLPLKVKKSILVSCIYGIDIDSNAIEVAKFSLLLKLLEDETIASLDQRNGILPNLDRNILQGNSLIDNNHFSEDISIEQKLLLSPFDWEDILPRFDAIIGNPPYVKTDDMIAFLPKREVDIYKQKYITSYKQFDKYYLFMERSLEKLKEDGILSFIIPNKFSKIDSGEKLREMLSKYNVREFIDFGSTQLFKDKKVIIYSSIISIIKQEPKEVFIFEEVNNINKWWTGHQDNPLSLKRMELDRKLLTKSPWILVASEEEWELINLLGKDIISLGDKSYFNTFNGVQTSAERPPIYSFKKSEIVKEDLNYYYIFKECKEYLIEKSITKPFFKPRRSKENNIKSYDSLVPDMQIIFPYDSNGKIFSPDVMEDKFPFAWKYLMDYKEELLPKQFSPTGKGRDVPHSTEDTWYHYGRNQAFKDFNNTPKVIIAINTHRSNPLNLLDNNNMVIASGGTAGYCAVSIADGSKYELEYLHAVLNHPAIVWLCSIMGSDFEGDYYSRGTYVLNKLPIKKIEFDDKYQMESYQRIIQKTKEIYKINEMLYTENLSRKDKDTLERGKHTLIKNIQDLVTDIYGIEHLQNVFQN